MAYNRLTLSQLYQRIKSDMEARLTGNVKIPPASMLSVLAFGMSGGSFMVQGFLEWIYNQILPDLADETGLKRLGSVYGIPEKSAVFTTGYVAFTGTTGIVVASGTQIQNVNGLSYTTQAAFTIDTTTSVEVVADEAGEDWNTTTGMEVVSPVSGVDDTVTIVSGFDDGEDPDTLENWRLRILQRIQDPPSSGTPADYERWALSIEGVSFAWCFAAEEWNGASTVGLAVSDTAHAQLSQSFLDSNVEPYIELLKPAPAQITYYSPTPIIVDYHISITPNTTAIKAASDENIEDLFLSDAAPIGTIKISQINSAIASSGASDYLVTGIDVDGSPVTVGNVDTTALQVHQLGTVTYSTLV